MNKDSCLGAIEPKKGATVDYTVKFEKGKIMG